jgi:hypothetical protein
MRSPQKIKNIFLSFIMLLFFKVSNGHQLGLKGKAYIFWGWNRGWYTDSDIRFEGENYNFTLNRVHARDRPSPFSLGLYMNPTNFTIPQNNFRLGYYFSDNFSISGGFDHMKYVMVQDQRVKIQGEINDGDPQYNGVYNDTTIVLTKSFLQYEHTNGLNYINFDLSHYNRIFEFPKIKTSIYFTEGIGAGILMPRTAVRFLNHELSDFYHIAGYGVNLKAGLSVIFYKIISIQAEVKGGFINLPDVRTSNSKADKAHQHFFFLQQDVLFGATFKLFRKVESIKFIK